RLLALRVSSHEPTRRDTYAFIHDDRLDELLTEDEFDRPITILRQRLAFSLALGLKHLRPSKERGVDDGLLALCFPPHSQAIGMLVGLLVDEAEKCAGIPVNPPNQAFPHVAGPNTPPGQDQP